MLLGIGVTTAHIIWVRLVNPTNSAEQWLIRISPEGIGIVGVTLNFIVTILVIRFTPTPPIEVQNMVNKYPLAKWKQRRPLITKHLYLYQIIVK